MPRKHTYVQLPGDVAKPNTRFLQKVKKHLRKAWAAWGIVLALGGYFGLRDSIHSEFTSNHELYKEKNFERGILIPGNLYNEREITFWIGSNSTSYDVFKLKAGASVYPSGILLDNMAPWDLRLKIRNNRLYISATINYANDDLAIGKISDNEWEIKNGTFYDYVKTDKYFEVQDQKRHVVISVQILNPNEFRLCGYFRTTDRNIVVVGGSSTRVVSESSTDIVDKYLSEIPSLVDNK